MIFVVPLKSDLDVQQTHLRGWFGEQKLMLSSSLMYKQIEKCLRYDFGHTFLQHLSWTWMFNKPTLGAGLLVCKSLCLARALGMTKLTNTIDILLVKFCCLPLSFLDVQQTHLRGLANKSSCLSPALGVTKFIIGRYMILA
jgi:hypothetical protein